MNMFCDDNVSDDEQADEDAGMLELKSLVEDKMAEEEEFENDLIARTKAEFVKCKIQMENPDTDADVRAATLKRLEELVEAHRKNFSKQINESIEKKKEETTKQCDEFMKNLFGEIDWVRCLKAWDDIILNEKSILNSSPSTSAETSTPKSTAAPSKSTDTKKNDKSVGIYAQFMNKPLPKPISTKPEDDREQNIRKITEKHVQLYLNTGSIDRKIFEIIVETSTQHHLKQNG